MAASPPTPPAPHGTTSTPDGAPPPDDDRPHGDAPPHASTSTPGHVFVIPGDLAHLDADAMVLPTDRGFTVERQWFPVLGLAADDAEADRSPGVAPEPGVAPASDDRTSRPPRDGTDDAGEAPDAATVTALRPAGWPDGDGRARATGTGTPLLPTWFVDSVRDPTLDGRDAADALADRVGHVLRAVARSDVRPGRGRSRVLVALPTLGVGGGDFGSLRGLVIDAQLAACRAAAEDTGIDVVVVARNASDYAAFQDHRRARLAGGGGVDDERARALARRARDGSLALFIAAGVGMGAGLPGWRQLIDLLAGDTDDPEGTRTALARLASPLDQAELLRMRLPGLAQRIAHHVGSTNRYAVAHALLASLRCRRAVTTNYDRLYELAVGDVDGALPISVLPTHRVAAHAPWLLKMHGDSEDPASIVLSRSDFVGFDSSFRPMGALVQALLLTQHVLVVGASMQDDNFLRLAYEIRGFLGNPREDGEPLFGTVLTLSEDPAQGELWRGWFDYVAVSRDPDDDRARELAVFLDRVAMHASRPSFALDVRYEQLLDPPEQDAARAARALLHRLEDLDLADRDRWSTVVEALRDSGAGG